MSLCEFGTDCLGTEEIYYVNETHQNHIINISLAGLTLPDSRYRIYKAADAYVFEYVCEGMGHIVHGEKTYDVAAGDFYLLPRRINCFYYADHLQPFKKKWFNISGSLISSLLDVHGIDKTNVFVKKVNVENLFDAILSAISVPTEKDSSISHYLLSLINTISEHRNDTQNQNLIHSIVQYLDHNIRSQIRLDDVAKQFHISRAHLIHIFKIEFGLTPYDYFLKQKIKVAEKLIRESDMQIQQIASELAFSDSHHFSTSFKKIHGISPTEYRTKN